MPEPPEKKQHTEINRKLALRKILLEKAGELPGYFYVPFCGDGDIAATLYKDHPLALADNDPEWVKTVAKRLPGAEMLQADCDSTFPFAQKKYEYSLVDCDSYAYPYAAFRQFWEHARKLSPMVAFFTDGQRHAIYVGSWHHPDGRNIKHETLAEKRSQSALYYPRVLLPWLEEYVRPWRVTETVKYLRTMNMVYWGAILEAPTIPESPATPAAIEEEETLVPIGKAIIANYQKFDKVKKKAFLEQVAAGCSPVLAAKNVGVHYQTVRNHIKSYPGFRVRLSEAQLQAIQPVEDSLYEAAKMGNTTAIIFYLQNRAPERWKDLRNVRQELTGAEGGPLQHELKGAMVTIDSSTLAEALRILADAGAVRLAESTAATEVDELHPA